MATLHVLSHSPFTDSRLSSCLRILGSHEGLPELPNCSIVLLRNPRSQSPVSETLAEHIVEGFKL